jgi:hypothetical protein
MRGKSAKRRRQTGALERLQAQLKSGKKPLKVDGRTTDEITDLSEGDVKRIKKQIEVLEKAVT